MGVPHRYAYEAYVRAMDQWYWKRTKELVTESTKMKRGRWRSGHKENRSPRAGSGGEYVTREDIVLVLVIVNLALGILTLLLNWKNRK